MYTSLIFNINVSTSVTTAGRAALSTLALVFESFLSNSVKFGSLNEVLTFIRNVSKEKKKRQYNDDLMLDKNVSIADCFAKIIDSCGYRWIPDNNEMEVIWQVINNLGQSDLNRVYYKNNLYEFLSNSSMKEAIKLIMKTLEKPFFNPLKCPPEIKAQIEEFSSILKEYVYYDKMIIDRIDRCTTMMRSVVMISDTDSCIVSLDAWYRFALEIVKDEELQIKKSDPRNVVNFFDKDEFGDYIDKSVLNPINFMPMDEDYDFYNDELVETAHIANPLTIIPQDWLRYSIINVMSCVLDSIINDYLTQHTKNNHSWREDYPCRLIAKNEFLFKRILMTMVCKSYASKIEVQEGNLVPKKEQIDIKGIASMAKSSMSDSTRDALKKILINDILEADTIDQFRVIKHLAVLEKKIINSIHSGSKEFYKPVTIKSMSAYDDPMRIQGIKASMVWNKLRDDNQQAINLDERNAIYVAKCNITSKTIDVLKDEYPDVYRKAVELLAEPVFKGSIDSIAVPLDVKVPNWLLKVIDYNALVNDNISGFPIESIGIQRLGANNVNYTNILQL